MYVMSKMMSLSNSLCYISSRKFSQWYL